MPGEDGDWGQQLTSRGVGEQVTSHWPCGAVLAALLAYAPPEKAAHPRFFTRYLLTCIAGAEREMAD